MSKAQFWFISGIFGVALSFTIFGSATNDRGILVAGLVWFAMFWFLLGRIEGRIGENDE